MEHKLKGTLCRIYQLPFVNSADSKKLTERTAVVQQARMNAKGAAQA